MSYNVSTINSQKPSITGDILLGLINLGGFTSSTSSAFLGVDASGNPKEVSTAGFLSLDVVYSIFIRADTWSGSGSASVGYRLEWRRQSGQEYVNSTYASTSYAGYPTYTTWSNQITLESGNYILHASMPYSSSSISDEMHIRLRNETASSDLGHYMMIGDGRSANTLQSYINLSAQSVLSWQVTALSGSWTIPDSTTHSGCHIIIIKV
tara:strand:- start:73 stop:699 length:627 start_codon:yes stop_codon:yes gene_type:complete